MNKRTFLRLALPALCAALWLAVFSTIGTGQLHAQCDSLTIHNGADCDVTVCFGNNPGNPNCTAIAAGRTVTIAVRQGAIPGVLNLCGGVASAPSMGGCVQGVQVTNTCCVDLCYHPSPCFVSISSPGTAPCSCTGHR